MFLADWSAAFGLLSAILTTLAYLPYLRDMLRGHALPLRSTWLIWTVLASVSFLSNVSQGATSSLLFLGVQTAFTALIFLLSIRFGMGSLVRRGDGHVLVLAGLGLLLWGVTHNPAWALVIAIGIGALGGAVTLIKTYRNPRSETLVCWLVATLAAACGVLSVGAPDPLLLAYPAYLLVLYGGIVVAIVLGRRRALRLVPLMLHPAQRADLPTAV